VGDGEVPEYKARIRAMEKKDLMHTIQTACIIGVELISPALLCDSIATIGLKEPCTVPDSTSLSTCIELMRSKRIGSLLVVDDSGEISGIFTERDCLMKILGQVSDLSVPVSEYMTKHPICERPEASLAFALNLMSNGGFRHIPIVDQDNMPIGIISVKDVVDHIVKKMLKAINEAVEGL
jgi:CBS domain-containing protein